jgi:hypothetical protein
MLKTYYNHLNYNYLYLFWLLIKCFKLLYKKKKILPHKIINSINRISSLSYFIFKFHLINMYYDDMFMIALKWI